MMDIPSVTLDHNGVGKHLRKLVHEDNCLVVADASGSPHLVGNMEKSDEAVSRR
jgi:hypothetical protein